MKALEWPVVMYGCESWSLRKNEETRLDAFEMKVLRKILRVSWTAKKTNGWSKEGTVRHCQSKEASILWSHQEETRELPGKRDNARNSARCTQARKTRTAWMDNIKTWTRLPVEDFVTMTQDRDKWRKLAHGVATGQPLDRGRLKNRTEPL